MPSHKYFFDLIEGKNKGIHAGLIRALLRTASWGFGVSITCRNWAYDNKFLSSSAPEGPIFISVGNIVVGGAGKTPVVQKLAHELSSEIPIAILSRGYKSLAEKSPQPTFLSKGNGPIYPASYCGDEAYLLSKHRPEAIVIVGKDRVKGAHMAAAAGAKVIILDDGLQYRKLARHLDVIVVNAKNPLGLGYLLPRGLLREHAKSLRRAHLIIVNHVQDKEHFEKVRKELSIFTDAPLTGVRPSISKALLSSGEEVCIQNKRVALFCGIAHPEQFYQYASVYTAKQEADVIFQRSFSDHHHYSQEEVISLVKDSKKLCIDYLLCTEKDIVKIVKSPIDVPVAALQMELEFVAGQEHWQEFVNGAKSLAS